MLNRVRVIKEHFMVGTHHYPVGSVMEVNDSVMDYLVKEGSVEVVSDGYLRRDMQAESKPRRRRRKQATA